jgi:hypothetical protein
LKASFQNTQCHPIGVDRSKTWLKTKCFTETTFLVIGTDRDRKRGALRTLLARTDSAGLIYAGPFIALAGDATGIKAACDKGSPRSRPVEIPGPASGSFNLLQRRRY